MARFSEVSALTPDGPGRFLGDLHPEWTIGGKPHGGYLLAMMGRAAALVDTHQHVIAASAHYLFAPEPGPVEIEAEVLRAGRSASQLRATMRQHGKPCVAALFTATDLDPDTKPYWADGARAPGDARIDDAQRLPPVNPSGVDVAILGHVDLRLDPESLGFIRGAAPGLGELHGWLTLPEDEPFDPLSLIFALDVLPPATFDVELSGWVPTLELTCYIRALPAPGPVRVVQKAHLIDAQRVDEACWVWDSTGRLVAHGTQLAGIRLGSPQ
jgi:hypothetical protein